MVNKQLDQLDKGVDLLWDTHSDGINDAVGEYQLFQSELISCIAVGCLKVVGARGVFEDISSIPKMD